jgi:hypothetical protein
MLHPAPHSNILTSIIHRQGLRAKYIPFSGKRAKHRSRFHIQGDLAFAAHISFQVVMVSPSVRTTTHVPPQEELEAMRDFYGSDELPTRSTMFLHEDILACTLAYEQDLQQ